MISTEELVDLPDNVSAKVLRGKVWQLAWPSISESSLLLLVGLSDVFLAGHLSRAAEQKLGYDTASALAGISAGQFFNWTANSALMAIGMAATALIARSIGSQDRPKAADFGRQSVLIAFVSGLIVSLIALLVGRSFIFLLGAEGQLVELGYLFLSTTAFGMPFNALLIVGNGSLRGSGDTRTPLFIMGCVNVVNIIVAWILINGQFGFPVLGIQGSAYGAISGWTLGAFMVMTRLYGLWPGQKGHPELFKLKFDLRPRLEYIRELVRIGLPAMGEQVVFQIGIFFFARFIVNLGTVVYAGHSAIVTIDSAAFLPGTGMATATTVLVGQCLGAGRPELARRYAVAAWRMGMVFMFTMGLSFFLFPEFFLRLLVDNEAVVAEASLPLRIAGIFDPALATSFILIGALRGAGDMKWPLYARIVGTWGMRVCLGALFIPILGLGLVGARFAMGLDSVAVAIFLWLRFRSGRWMKAWAGKQNVLPAQPRFASGPVAVAAVSPSPSEEEA